MHPDNDVRSRSRFRSLLGGVLAVGLATCGMACASKSGGPQPSTGGKSGGGPAGNAGIAGSATGGAAGGMIVSGSGGTGGRETGGGGAAAGGAAAGGAAGGGRGRAGAGGGAPDVACGIPTTVTSPPYPTEIRFVNEGAAPLYLHAGCLGIEYGLSSCASGYRDSLEPTFHCGCSCDSASCTGSVSCGGCPAPAGTPVAAGTFATVTWDGEVRTDETRGTYACVRTRFVTAGRHRVAVRVYDDEAAARDLRGGRIVTQDFDLPVPAGVLKVPLATVQADPCAGPPEATTPACTGAEPRDVACTLALSMTYGQDGGLVDRTDSSTIAPPASYVLTRRFANSTTMPDQQCSGALPLCARDARVVTTSDLTRVLTNAVVAGAFGANLPLFGHDPRPTDGTILVLRRPDGNTLGIGSSGPGAEVPPELLDAQTVLSRLDGQMLGDPACANLAR